MKTNKKPIAKLTGEDGNVFNLLGIASRALEKDNPEKVLTHHFGIRNS